MTLKDGQRLFYDDLVRTATLNIEQYKSAIKRVPPMVNFSVRKSKGENPIPITEKVVMDRLEKRVRNLRESHVFLIDGATADSLYYSDHSKGDYPNRIYLPFPKMFFEFEFSIDQQKDIGPKNIKAMIFSREQDSINSNKDSNEGEKYFAEFIEKGAPHNGQALSFHSLVFNLNELPNFTFFDMEKGIYKVDYESRNIRHINLPLSSIRDLSPRDSLTQSMKPKISEYQDLDISDELRRYSDFIINLLDLINAENVVIQKGERRTKKIVMVGRKGKKKKRKQAIMEPYHWEEIKKTYANIEPKEEGKSLEFRVWVRGHHHKYHTNNGVIKKWIKCYIKGPKNATWRHHRYAVLYKRFRHLLDRRGNENIGDLEKRLNN